MQVRGCTRCRLCLEGRILAGILAGLLAWPQAPAGAQDVAAAGTDANAPVSTNAVSVSPGPLVGPAPVTNGVAAQPAVGTVQVGLPASVFKPVTVHPMTARERREMRTAERETVTADTCVTFLDIFQGVDSADELGLAILVIAAVVAVGGIVIYTGRFVYDVVAGAPDYGLWVEVAPQAAWMPDDTLSGTMDGVVVGAGLKNRFERVDFGLLGEFGVLDWTIEATDESIEGTYWLVGPVVRLRFDEDPDTTAVFFDFVAGGGEDERIDVISRGRIGLDLPMLWKLRAGVYLGGLIRDVDLDENVVKEYDSLDLIMGGQMGVRF